MKIFTIALALAGTLLFGADAPAKESSTVEAPSCETPVPLGNRVTYGMLRIARIFAQLDRRVEMFHEDYLSFVADGGFTGDTRWIVREIDIILRHTDAMREKFADLADLLGGAGTGTLRNTDTEPDDGHGHRHTKVGEPLILRVHLAAIHRGGIHTINETLDGISHAIWWHPCEFRFSGEKIAFMESVLDRFRDKVRALRISVAPPTLALSPD